jgi:hypothetical protein
MQLLESKLSLLEVAFPVKNEMVSFISLAGVPRAGGVSMWALRRNCCEPGANSSGLVSKPALCQGTTSVVPKTRHKQRTLQAAENLNPEGAGGFNPRTKPAN